MYRKGYKALICLSSGFILARKTNNRVIMLTMMQISQSSHSIALPYLAHQHLTELPQSLLCCAVLYLAEMGCRLSSPMDATTAFAIM